eukprot:1191157-Prorocentrum_minimum.AAC.1
MIADGYLRWPSAMISVFCVEIMFGSVVIRAVLGDDATYAIRWPSTSTTCMYMYPVSSSYIYI